MSEKTWECSSTSRHLPRTRTLRSATWASRTHRMGGLNQFDIGVFKNFTITEVHRIQFRAEFFNAFNHPTSVHPIAALGHHVLDCELVRSTRTQYPIRPEIYVLILSPG